LFHQHDDLFLKWPFLTCDWLIGLSLYHHFCRKEGGEIMNTVTIVVDAEKALAEMGAIASKHAPFVVAATLTRVAEMARNEGRRITRQHFKLHTDFIPQSIRFKPASKYDLKTRGEAYSSVFTTDKISGYMPLHESGGEKNPHLGRTKIALPTTDLSMKGFQTGSGAVRYNLKPKTLLANYQGPVAPGKRVLGALKKAFIIRSKKNPAVTLIVRRKTKGRFPLERLFFFEPRTKIAPRWHLVPTITRYVDLNFRPVLEKKWQEANK
jgi:hypothetical protein